jgi:hypothetical protein
MATTSSLEVNRKSLAENFQESQGKYRTACQLKFSMASLYERGGEVLIAVEEREMLKSRFEPA